MAKKQPQLCLVTYLATSGAQIHAVVTTAQRILLAQIGRLTVDHGLVDQGMPVAEVRDAMTALKSIAGTADLTKMHVPKPHAWGFDLPEPVCTCRASGLGRVTDPSCQIHGGVTEQKEPPGGYVAALGRVADVIGTTPQAIVHAAERDSAECTCPGHEALNISRDCLIHGIRPDIRCTCKHPGRSPVTRDCPQHGEDS